MLLTYQVHMSPSMNSIAGNKKLTIVKNGGNIYYILSEKALQEPITITDSKGNLYFVLSKERLMAIGPRAVGEFERIKGILKNP